jgi:hypothetical protein
MSLQLYEEIEDVNGALIELFEKYHAGLPQGDRVQMVQDVRDLLSVAMQTAEHDAEGDAEGDAEDGILTQIQELDHALEQALNAPDNEMIGLLESAEVMSKDLVDRVGYNYMGGKRPHRGKTHRGKTHRGKTHRGKTHRGKTHRGKTHRKRNIKRTHRNRK